MTDADVTVLALKVLTRVKERGCCAAFLSPAGALRMVGTAGAQFASTADRYRQGMVGSYDCRAQLEQVKADILEVEQGRSAGA